MVSEKIGGLLVDYARKALECHYHGGKPKVHDEIREVILEDGGCFVTLKTYPAGGLRGCIGYPEPAFPLGIAIEKSAVAAAKEDPRFPSVSEGELDSLTVELSVMTRPEPVMVGGPGEYLEKIRVGKDGLIAERKPFRGLLLPQVPVELGWSVEEFLERTCGKAGLEPDSWKNPDTTIYRFQAEVFSEKSPGGVVEKKLLD